MRKEAVHAGLLYGWIKNQLGFAVFMLHRVVMFDGNSAEWLAIGGNPISKDAKICDVRDQPEGN